MTTLACYQDFVADAFGNAVAGASIEVRRESDDGLASLYSDRAGVSPLTNPFIATDAKGYFQFFVVGGAYKVKTTAASVTTTLRYVAIGTDQEGDRLPLSGTAAGQFAKFSNSTGGLTPAAMTEDGSGNVLAAGNVVAEKQSGTEVEVAARGYSVPPDIHGYAAAGSKTSPSALTSGSLVLGIGGRPYDGSAFTDHSTAAFHHVAVGNQSGSNLGSRWEFATTPLNSIIRYSRGCLSDQGTLVLRDPTGTFDYSSTAQVAPILGCLYYSLRSDGLAAGYCALGFGSAGAYRGGMCGGTPASPSASVSGNLCCFMGGHGHDGSSWSAGTKALVGFYAAENWTSSAQGMYADIEVTPTGSTTRAKQFQVGPGAHVYAVGAQTTANAANAYLDSGSTPVNELLRSTSSARYKRDIEPLDPSYADAILNLQPIWYRSKCECDNPDWSWWGLLAEDVAAIDPRLVHYGYQDDAWDTVLVETEDGDRFEKKVLKPNAQKVPDGVAYERLTVLLLDLVRRQNARIAILEAGVKAG